MARFLGGTACSIGTFNEHDRHNKRTTLVHGQKWRRMEYGYPGNLESFYAKHDRRRALPVYAFPADVPPSVSSQSQNGAMVVP